MLTITNLCKSFDKKVVFDNFSHTFQTGKVTAILGNSGIGKTTLLKTILHLTDYSGEISATENSVAVVFQQPQLLEHLTALQNVEYALSGVEPNALQRKNLAFSALEHCQILHLKDTPCKVLSGGEKQRVALSRALAFKADLWLLDEPFSSLDIGLKHRLIDLYANLLQKSPKTVLFVTHSVSEATLLADEILVLSESGKKVFEVNFEKSERTLFNSRFATLCQTVTETLKQEIYL